MRWRRAVLPALLIAAFAGLAIGGMARLSITGDEVSHLPSGYSYVTTGDFRLNPQHPPLMKALAAVPLLGLDLKPAVETEGWEPGREWRFGRDFLTANRTPLARIVFWGRLPMVLVGVLLCAALFAWARALWGYWPALFVLLLCVFCPNLLAHAPLVHTDVGVTAFTVATLYALWRYGRSGQLRWALACGAGLGLTLLAKYSGLVTAGLVALLFGAIALRHLFGRDGGAVEAAPRFTRRRLALAALALAVIPVAMIAVGFGCPHGLRHYARGVTLIHADLNPEWQAFLWGEYSKHGFWYYYLLAQLWKTPLPTLLCFAAALLLIDREPRATRLDWAFILLPIAAFHAAGMWQHASIGVRHVLPAFPFIMLAGGATAVWIGRQCKRWKVAFAALCVWLVAGTLRVAPDFLPYFNELAGGPAGGPFYLDDSNTEWGQGFYELADYLDTHHPARPRLLAFEPLPHEQYGIRADPILLRDVVWPEEGVTYLVGASFLQRFSLFNGRPGVRFEWLGRYRPVDHIGGSIYVFRFSTDPADQHRRDVIYVPREQWYATALERLTPMVARWPDFRPATEPLPAVYADRARWREEQGQYAEALADYLAAAMAAPASEAYRQLLRDALQRLASRLPADDASPAIAFRQAAVRCAAGERSGCLLALLRTLHLDPRHLQARSNLGALYAQLGLRRMAAAEWQRCLEIDPDFAPARENLARLDAAPAERDHNPPPQVAP